MIDKVYKLKISGLCDDIVYVVCTSTEAFDDVISLLKKI